MVYLVLVAIRRRGNVSAGWFVTVILHVLAHSEW